MAPDAAPAEAPRPDPLPGDQPTEPFFHALELARTRALVARDLETFERLHAPQYQLITPAGKVFSRQAYLDALRAGPFYTAWDIDDLSVRVTAQMAALRYLARLEFPSGRVLRCWHTDIYEQRTTGWQAVWSQATEVPVSGAGRGAARWACAAALWAAPLTLAMSAPESAQQQVFAAERAFARSMADRNLSAFAGHVAEEAVFFTAAVPYRGKAEVVAGWARFFEGAAAPFSWEPDQVEVLPSGTLALSTGLVRNPGGKVIGRFNSVWRQEAPSVWRVVFDKGSPPEPGDGP